MTSSTPPTSAEGVRLQKVLAAAGFGSRRKCEELIDRGRVTVNGALVTGQGRRVDAANDVIRVDGERIGAPPGAVVLAMNKPLGVLSAMSDDRGRECVGDLVRGYDPRLVSMFHVGRLDAETDGLLLVTNDGNLAQLLSHPKHGVEKTYLARVSGEVRPPTLRRIQTGVKLDDRKVEVNSVRLKASSQGTSLVEIVIHEGRKHVVRRLFEEVGHPVKELTRIRFGPIKLGGLQPGQFRELSEEQISRLFDAVSA